MERLPAPRGPVRRDNKGGRSGAGSGAPRSPGWGGWGWGAATPGRALAAGASRRVLGGDRGAGAGIWGPGAGGRARLPLTRRSAGGAAPAGAGFPAPAAADGSVPHGRAPPPPAAGSAAPAAPGPPPAAASGHGAEPPRGAGRGRAAGQTHGPGPMDHSAATSLPRYGASEGQARPAHPRARPRGPRLQRARTRTRRAPPTPAPAGCPARRSEGMEWHRTRAGRRESVRLSQGLGLKVRPGEGVDSSNPSRGSGVWVGARIRPKGLTRAGRLGIRQLIDGSVIQGRPGPAEGALVEQDP